MIKYDADFYSILAFLRTGTLVNMELALQISKNLYPQFYEWFNHKIDVYLMKYTVNGDDVTEFGMNISQTAKYLKRCNLWVRIDGRKFNLKFYGILLIYIMLKEYLGYSEISNCVCGKRNFCSYDSPVNVPECKEPFY